MGDVLRTTPLLPALKKKFRNCRITWLVDPKCAGVLEHNSQIGTLIKFSAKNLSILSRQRFDLAVNLDKEQEALDAIAAVRAAKKMGFGRSAAGELCALDGLSDYATRLGIDDELKFRINQKSYQEISFEQLGLRFKKEEYQFTVNREEVQWAKRTLQKTGAKNNHGPLIGLNTGSGNRFAGKKLPIETVAELAQKLTEQLNATVLLLGGKDEIKRNKKIMRLAPRWAFNAGSHLIRRFAAIVRHCDLVVTGDTIAMHIAIAAKVPVVAFFASTCAAEIELYGRGKKIVSEISCAPCYKKICPIDEQCMKDMKVETLVEAAREVLAEKFK